MKLLATRVIQVCLLAIVLTTLPSCSARKAFVTYDHRFDSSQLDQLRNITQIELLPPLVKLTHHHLLDDPVKLGHQEKLLQEKLASALFNWAQFVGFRANSFYPVSKPESFDVFRLISISERALAARSPMLPGVDHQLPSLGSLAGRLLKVGDSNSKALLIARYSGYVKSTGQRRKERVASALRSLLSLGRTGPKAPPKSNGDLMLVLLDGATGDVLWHGAGQASPEQVTGLAESLASTLLQPPG